MSESPRALTQRDVDRFAALSGDRAPMHVDPAWARGSALGATVAHGMMLYALIGAALSRRLAVACPRGWLPLEQTLAFAAPTWVGDAVAVETAAAGDAMRFATRVRNQQGATTVDGEAVAAEAAAGYPRRRIDDSFALGDLESDAALLDLALGQSASVVRTFTDADLDEYVDLVGDRNPPVVDARAARAIGLPARMVAGPLVGALLQQALGERLPGRGCDWVRQRLSFHSTAVLGEPLTASVTVTRLRRDGGLASLGCVVSADDGRSVATGEALLRVAGLAPARAPGALHGAG